MNIIARELKKPFEPDVQQKANITEKISSRRAAKEKAARVSGGSSEVMVKITGFGKGQGHVEAHIRYIARHGKVELEDNKGQKIVGSDEMKEFFSDWNKTIHKERKKQRDTMHSVFSMPPGTPPETVKIAVRRLASETFKNHEYVMALHTDTTHPHVHLTVKMKGFDGKLLNPRKADLQRWRESFAEKMRAQGIDAEATPRLIRGVVKKAEKNVVRHIEQGDKTHKPRVPKVKAKAIKENTEELISELKGVEVKKGAWVGKIKAGQQSVREAWLSIAESLKVNSTNTNEIRKELKNERPDYSSARIGSERVRIARLAAQHLYKSDVDKAQGKGQTITIASLRNLPSLDVVHIRKRSEMLLRKDAHNGVGARSGASNQVRRSGNGDTSLDSGERISNEALSKQIEKFVATMPPIQTQNDEIKAKLTKQFTKEVTKDKETTGDKSKDLGKEITKAKDKDIER